jgi:uncharacterized protein (TIRG00374 family)
VGGTLGDRARRRRFGRAHRGQPRRRAPHRAARAIAYWGFGIAVLGLSFKAFNQEMSVAVLVMGYLVGTFGSLLPLPGGVGGIEAGMIGSFAVSGIPVGRAVVGVLACRAISF